MKLTMDGVVYKIISIDEDTVLLYGEFKTIRIPLYFIQNETTMKSLKLTITVSKEYKNINKVA